MFKNGTKNFFKNLLCVFVPMGIIYLVFIIAVFSFVSGVLAHLSTMLTDILEIIRNTANSSSEEVKGFLDYAVGRIDWSAGYAQVAEQISSTDWLTETVTGFLETLNQSSAGFDEEMTAKVNEFFSYVKSALAACVSAVVFSVFLADMVTGYLLRRKTAKKTIKQSLISWLLKPIMSAAVTSVLAIIAVRIKGFVLLVYLAVAIVYTLASLAFAWVVYRDDKVKFGQVVNAKNVGLSFAVTALIIAIVVLVFFVLTMINLFVAILVLVPLIVYAFNIIAVNADSYVCMLTE